MSALAIIPRVSEPAPDYSIIVPAYNEAAQLPRTLPAIRAAMSGVDAVGELIVVDNNSTDATAGVAEQHGAEVVFEPVNMIGRARNAGAAASRSRLLIFIDADSWPTAELLAGAKDAVECEGCVGGGAKVALDPSPSWLLQRMQGVWNIASPLLGYPAGCFFFCRRDAFEAVGGFSEDVYASEEIWLARRLKKWGRSRKMKMRILGEMIQTSSRKMDKPGKTLGMMALMFLFPLAVRFRGLCGYWYKREA